MLVEDKITAQRNDYLQHKLRPYELLRRARHLHVAHVAHIARVAHVISSLKLSDP